MLKYVQGNLLNDNAEAFVTTVNCTGIVGNGIALQFKRAYPTLFRAYTRACDAQKVSVTTSMPDL
jgi:O-acetyl-ADP-ribose deacetylase (regulator of RNase III)